MSSKDTTASNAILSRLKQIDMHTHTYTYIDIDIREANDQTATQIRWKNK
jgi:hypothetical protein